MTESTRRFEIKDHFFFKYGPYACSALVIAVGCLVLIGWQFHIPILKSILPQYITMKANTAIGLIALAVAVSLMHRAESDRLRMRLARMAAAFAFLIGLATLFQYLFNYNLGIDELIFEDRDASGRIPPGRLAPVTAVIFMLLGGGILLSNDRHKAFYYASQFLVLVAFLISLQALMAYAFGIDDSFGIAAYTRIALHTAGSIVLVAMGILIARPDRGLIAILTADSAGGFMARRLIATAILVPPFVNWLQLVGQKAGFYDADFGVLLRITGNVVFFVVIVWRNAVLLHRTDIKRKAVEDNLEETVQRRTEELTLANHELEAFSYSVSHDLRAPLRGITGFSQMLLKDHAAHLGEEGKNYLQRVHEASIRMSKLIDSLLNLSRVKEAALKKQPVDLSQLAEEAVRDLKESNPARNVEFVIAAKLTAECDRDLMRVVMQNLLGNAWKYTSTKPAARIEFGADRSAKNSTFFVRDNGVGFDIAYAKKLFAPFHRLHSEREFEGTGIGLATVQRILQRHGGNVWAQSNVGQGSVFYFSF